MTSHKLASFLKLIITQSVTHVEHLYPISEGYFTSLAKGGGKPPGGISLRIKLFGIF